MTAHGTLTIRWREAWLAALCAAVTLAAGCGGGGGGSKGGGSVVAPCSETARKDFVYGVTQDWYLFPELLPASVNLAEFATAEELLDHLTAAAREQGKDRHFSFLTTRQADNSALGEGQFNGFGFRMRNEPGDRPFILDVYESSPASDGGLQRGDEITAIDSGSGFVPVSEIVAGGGTVSDALGPPEVGVQRGLRLLRDGLTREVSLTKRTTTIDPVSNAFGVRVLPLAGTTGVGYVNLRAYISTADVQLRDAFAQLGVRNLDYFIVDLRYNGGGLVSIAELLNDLLGGARRTSDVQLRMVHSEPRSAENRTTFFQPGVQSVRPVRIAFLTTDATASASEINVNSMKPWVETAIVGTDTYGKPVGQYAFDLQGCDDRLRLVSFKTVNAADEGDYYDGLAATLPFACAAEDTLDRPLGDASEGMIAAGLEWLQTGACGAVIAPTAAARAMGATVEPKDRYPMPRNPSPAERMLPGLK
jgi:C-terminal processing protease CtpA/Prc